MSVIRVTAEELASTANALQMASNTITETSNNAMGAISSLVGAGWQGGGSAAAEAAMQEWQKGSVMVQDALAKLGGLITQAENAYTETDSSVASSFS